MKLLKITDAMGQDLSDKEFLVGKKTIILREYLQHQLLVYVSRHLLYHFHFIIIKVLQSRDQCTVLILTIQYDFQRTYILLCFMQEKDSSL